MVTVGLLNTAIWVVSGTGLWVVAGSETGSVKRNVSGQADRCAWCRSNEEWSDFGSKDQRHKDCLNKTDRHVGRWLWMDVSMWWTWILRGKQDEILANTQASELQTLRHTFGRDNRSAFTWKTKGNSRKGDVKENKTNGHYQDLIWQLPNWRVVGKLHICLQCPFLILAFYLLHFALDY